MKTESFYQFLKPGRAENCSVKRCSIVVWFSYACAALLAGSLILIVPKKLSLKKKKGSDSQLKPSNSFDSNPDLKKALDSHDSPLSPTQSSFKKVESWNCQLPFTGKAYPPDSSFLKFLPKSKPASDEPPGDDPIKSKLMENDRHGDDEKIKDVQIPVDSLEFNNDNSSDKGAGAADSMSGCRGSTVSVIDHSLEAISNIETLEPPIFCDSRVLVGDHYYAKGSDASILRSILNKQGDIAQNCKLTSKAMCSYYLECLCLIVRELQSSAVDKMSNSKLQEMLAIVKDVEAAGIEVGWLQKIIDEIRDAIELVEKSRSIKAEKKRCESSVESVRDDLEARMQDLDQKEREAAVARVQVEETREQLSKLEQECSRLNEAILSIQSRVDSIDCKAKVDGIL